MTLRLIREPSQRGTTLGVLFRDGHFFGFTLEDEIREVPGQSVERWKVPGHTAIPEGRYRVHVIPSPRFGRPLPRLIGVPGFDGILIHTLNTSQESEGCIGVGLSRDDATRRIYRSAVACRALQDLMEAAQAQGQSIWIDIENPRA